MGFLLVVFLSELSTFEHFNDFLDTFNTDIEESRVLGGGWGGWVGGVKKSHWISVQREVGLALEQGPHRGKGLNLIT